MDFPGAGRHRPDDSVGAGLREGMTGQLWLVAVVRPLGEAERPEADLRPGGGERQASSASEGNRAPWR